ncbi:penicillin-binding transpeptidase domain-containing protein [Desmospora profundinema]|uniref:Cell division protein FtsI/penicillin-binding protein 2 n=1 Tax=Desmospora profundinema TaxID=1571184 RepID=A0ABU1IJ52_9BACL|nr:penicillin-binding transpeptidase domain-containing protein [Desmospora profundinema]MDR6224807.1 cell division protein FtsI/penicillin-binding protein 2 [Desmospora profundinema]
MTPSNKQIRLRSLLVGMTAIFLLSAVIFRLFWIQAVDASFLRERAEKTWEKQAMIRPDRGSIMDRNGHVLVRERDAYIIAVDLKRLKDPEKAAQQLSPLLEIPEESLLKRLTNKEAKHVELRHTGNYKVSREVRDRVMKLGLDGVYPIQTTSRQYLEGSQASHVLGFVNVEGDPAGGVEQRYNNVLKGKAGSIRFQKDAKGNKAPHSTEAFHPPENGKDLVLTLDREIQYQMEKSLDQTVARYQAKGATAIAADPQTGEILAMASRPHFNPAQYDSTWKRGENDVNTAVSAQYEPGSTFKIVTLAASIEEGLFDSRETFQSGTIEVGNRTIRDWNAQGWGEISFAEGVYLSSNVAFVRLGERLGEDRLVRYIDRFGFGNITNRTGQATGIDLPAEGKGVFFGHAPLHPTERATSAFGQGIAVTPIQQVMAVSAIANNGILVRPHVVKEIRNPSTGKAERKESPKVIRKDVVSPQTAKEVRLLLQGAVNDGTGQEARMEGYTVGGKTGTAQKPLPGGKGYASGQYIVSFIGFAPVDKPRVVVYVAVDEPKEGQGGTVAAPAARDIMKHALQEMGVAPDGEERDPAEAKKRNAPAAKVLKNWVQHPVDEAVAEIRGEGWNPQVLGGGREVIRQYPAAGERGVKENVYLITEDPPALAMPDLTGLPLREALALCRVLGLEAETTGEGYVRSQSIPAGERIMDAERIQLNLQPPD